MKRFSLIAFACSLIFLHSCRPKPVVLTAYRPVLMDRSSLERSIFWSKPADIKSPAKIYYKDNFILISERYKGVHVVDNSDPKNPIKKGYINVPGCVDMAMKENILYVDNAVDLVAIDISQIANNEITVKSRIKETFPELIPPDGMTVPEIYNMYNRPKNSVIINWIK